MSLANPQSFNRYAYVENQPTNFVDPSGLLLAIPLYSCTYYHDLERSLCTISGYWIVNDTPSSGPGGDVTVGGGGGGDKKTNENNDCSISVEVLGASEMKDPAGESYGFKFNVTGNVKSGGIGFVGEPTVNQNKVRGNLGPGSGIWTIGQTLISSFTTAQYAGDLVPRDFSRSGDDSPRPHSRTVTGNNFSWSDSPGFYKSNGENKLLSASMDAAFRMYVKNDSGKVCSVFLRVKTSFKDGKWSGTYKWGLFDL